jgi:hypothetical protein
MGLVGDDEFGSGVVDEQLALRVQEIGVQQDRDHPDSQRAEHCAQQGGRGREVEGHPIAGGEPGGHQGPGRTTLAFLRLSGREDFDDHLVAHGSSAVGAMTMASGVRSRSPRARKMDGRTAATRAKPAKRNTAPATVTDLTPVWLATLPCTTAPMG